MTRQGRTDPRRWEVPAALLTVLVAWLCSQSVGGASRALERRLAARQAEIDRLAAAQDVLRARQLEATADIAPQLAQHLGEESFAALFPGRRVAVHGVDGSWLLALEPITPPPTRR